MSCTGTTGAFLLTLLYSKRPKFYAILAFLSAVGLIEMKKGLFSSPEPKAPGELTV